MPKYIINYPYAQIDDNNIVTVVSLMCSVIQLSHPLYNYLIPIREYDATLLEQRYIGCDSDGYGLFEPVPEPEEPTKEQNEAVAE